MSIISIEQYTVVRFIDIEGQERIAYSPNISAEETEEKISEYFNDGSSKWKSGLKITQE